jgi:hypothetical protein
MCLSAASCGGVFEKTIKGDDDHYAYGEPCQQDLTGCEFVKDYKNEFDITTATRSERPLRQCTLFAIFLHPSLTRALVKATLQNCPGFGQGDTAELPALRSRRHCRTALASVKATLQNCRRCSSTNTTTTPASSSRRTRATASRSNLATSLRTCTPRSISTPATTTTTRVLSARGDHTSAIKFDMGELISQWQFTGEVSDAIRDLITAAVASPPGDW